MKSKLFSRIPYPKLFLLLISFYIARLILTDANNFYFHEIIDRLGYGASFLSGFFFNFGFTFAPSVAALIVLSNTQHFLLSGIVASLGSIFGNYFFYRIIKISFEDEIKQLSSSSLFKAVAQKLHNKTPLWIRSYILPIFAGIIVSTPLPDELGVAMIASSHKISFPIFSVVTFVFSAFGIFIILAIGRLIG